MLMGQDDTEQGSPPAASMPLLVSPPVSLTFSFATALAVRAEFDRLARPWHAKARVMHAG
ncbi:hypothetical protein AZA_34840 [Nitrospirillum viridazoti Y2]|nr:hypothetical protein AZA_34840 [Nitrospirillum amazonense Y2]